MPDADGRIRPIAVPRVPWHEWQKQRDQMDEGLTGSGSKCIEFPPGVYEWREQRGYIDKPMDTAESVQADGTTKCSICGTTKCNCPE